MMSLNREKLKGTIDDLVEKGFVHKNLELTVSTTEKIPLMLRNYLDKEYPVLVCDIFGNFGESFVPQNNIYNVSMRLLESTFKKKIPHYAKLKEDFNRDMELNSFSLPFLCTSYLLEKAKEKRMVENEENYSLLPQEEEPRIRINKSTLYHMFYKMIGVKILLPPTSRELPQTNRSQY